MVLDVLIAELEALGHDAVAVDLPGHGERASERSTLDGYCRAILDVLEPGDVLVGHSMGGIAITMAADAFQDVAHCTYLAASVPAEGESVLYEFEATDQMGPSRKATPAHGTVVNPLDDHVQISEDGSSFSISSLHAARACFYHDCRDEIVRWAFERLTPQSVSVLVDEKVSVPRFWDAESPRSFIICTDDRAEPFAGYMERQAERLGVEPLRIGTSHSPFLSRPGELAGLLINATSTVAVGRLKPTL